MARLELYGKTADKAALKCLQLSHPPTDSAAPGSAPADVDGIKRRLEEDAQLWKAASSEGHGWSTSPVYHPLFDASHLGRHLLHYLQDLGSVITTKWSQPCFARSLQEEGPEINQSTLQKSGIHPAEVICQFI